MSGSGDGYSGSSGGNPPSWYQTQSYPPESSYTQPPYPTPQYDPTYTPTPEPAYTPPFTPPPPNLDTAPTTIQQTLDYINQAKLSIATQLASGCSACIDKVTTIQNTIYEKLATTFNTLTNCYSNCQQSVVSQLSGQYSSAVGGANTAICNCPACPTAPPTTPTAVTVGPVTLTPSQEQEYKAYSQQFLDGTITAQQFNEYTAKFFIPPPPIPPPVQPIPPFQLPTCPITTITIKCHKYFGFCNLENGNLLSIRDDESPPGFPYIQVSVADDANTALEAARDYCDKKRKPPKEYTPSGYVQNFPGDKVSCDIGIFNDINKLTNIFPEQTVSALANTFFQIVNSVADGAASSIENLPIAGAIAAAFKQFLVSPLAVKNDVIPYVAKVLGCNDEPWKRTLFVLNQLSYFESRYGLDIGEFKRSFHYILNSLCRERHLEPGQALEAYLSDQIDDKTLDSLWAMHGYCPNDAYWAKQSNRSKLSPGELLLLRRRGTIGDTEYHDRMRQVGYLDKLEAEKIYSLATELPPVQDIIRFMVRDTDDREIVDSLQLDALFEHKFGPQLKQWAKQRGIPDDMMQHEWRAHWAIPGPSQLFSFWQRLRRNPNFGTPEQQRSKIEKALIHNDILPTWFDSYFAVQYRPIGRIDIRRGFNSGILDEQQVNDGFAAIGYSDDDADNLTQITKQQRIDSAGNSKPIRLWTTLAISSDDCKVRLAQLNFDIDDITDIMHDAEHKFISSYPIKAFVAGTMAFPTARLILSDLGVSNDGIDQMHRQTAELVHSTPHVIDYQNGTETRNATENAMDAYGVGTNKIRSLLDHVDATVRRESTLLCVRGIKKNFATGGNDADEARNSLTRIGITLERANTLISSWQCENSSKSKSIAASTLCGWLSTGAITSIEFVHRLVRIGYDESDANLLLGDCLKRINEGLAKKEQKNIADRVKAEKAAAQQNEKVAKALAREQDQLDKARAASKRAKLNRQKQLTSAASSVQKICNCDLATALATVQLAKDTLQNDYAFKQDEALQLLVTSAAKWKGGDPSDYIHLVMGEATLARVSGLSSSIEPLVSVDNLNGSIQ